MLTKTERQTQTKPERQTEEKAKRGTTGERHPRPRAQGQWHSLTGGRGPRNATANEFPETPRPGLARETIPPYQNLRWHCPWRWIWQREREGQILEGILRARDLTLPSAWGFACNSCSLCVATVGISLIRETIHFGSLLHNKRDTVMSRSNSQYESPP